ncbi:MAG: HD domain-containing protein [Candidatus Absconditicoccaceae bacterium]
MKEHLNWKLFRKRENDKKIKFIIQNSGIDLQIVLQANALSNTNDYHNFGHQLGVSEVAIKLGTVQGLSSSEINALGFGGLTHDGGHTGKALIDDEMKSVELINRFFPDEAFTKLGFSRITNRDLTLSTAFSQRGKWARELAKILQDADLGNIGQGPYYWLYSSMGLADEFGGDPYKFISEEQEKFVKYLESIDPNVFLSSSSQKVYIPARKSLTTILNRPKEVIDYAYRVRHNDISFSEFKKQIDWIIKKTSI